MVVERERGILSVGRLHAADGLVCHVARRLGGTHQHEAIKRRASNSPKQRLANEVELKIKDGKETGQKTYKRATR